VKALYTNIEGQGRPLVLLHGWGMNSHVWQPILPALAQRAQVITIDLPGHGANSHLPLGTLESVVEQLAEHIPPDAIIMGWSLGGLIAQALAHALPERVAALILVASTPKFVADANGNPRFLPTSSPRLRKICKVITWGR
jgi:pimeloyl-[acyl-carrier protein] methyl ester esterase